MSQVSEDAHRPRTTELRDMAGEAGKRKGCCTRCPGLCGGILVVTAVVSLAGAAVLGGLYPKLHQTVDKLIESNVALTNDSPALSNFKSSSVPVYMYYYFFNVTNPDDVQTNGAVPIVTEVGPFTYIENKTKYDLAWNEDETEMNYTLETTYTFDESRSQGNNPNTTIITTVNVPLIGVALMIEKLEKDLEKKHSWLKPLVDFVVKELDKFKEDHLLSNDGLFTKRSVRDLLFGYQDQLLTDLLDLTKLIPKSLHVHVDVSNIFNFSSNVSYEGPNIIHTGKDNQDLMNQYIMWNNQTLIEKWGSPAARKINGTDGTMFHPGVTREENLTSFISELLRSGYFSYVKDVELYGINLLRFGLPSDELKNTSQDPGFYPNGPSGVLNLTAVFPQNVPLFASKPHFLDADPAYRRNVSGLHPDPIKHDSHLDIEPLTGAALSAAKRIQLNLRLQEYKYLPEITSIPSNVMLPVWYASEEGDITEPLADEFKQKVYSIEYGVLGGIFGVIGVLVLVCVVCVLCLVGLIIQQWKVRRSKRRHVVPTNDEYAPLLTAGGRLNTNI